MKHVVRVLAAAMFVLGFNSTALRAGEAVSFQGPPSQPTPFKVKRAKAKGIILDPIPGQKLQGFLAQPKGPGPFPAVIILVGGTGLKAYHLDWADLLAANGYVALVIDSFGSKGGVNYLDTPAMDMTADAFTGHYYLSGLEYVDKTNIGLLGFSMGGSHAQYSVSTDMKRRPDGVDFAAAVTFYPACGDDRHLNAPVLILAGDKDDLISLARCQALQEATKSDDFPATLHVYANATHFFDDPDYARDTSLHHKDWQEPLWYETNTYDSTAHSDAKNRTLDFFNAHMK